MKKRDTKKRKVYKYSRKMRKMGNIGTRKLKGGQWWRWSRLFGPRETSVAPEPMPQPAPEPSFWSRMFARPARVAPAPQPPVASNTLPSAEVPVIDHTRIANSVVPEEIALNSIMPEESLPYEELLTYVNTRKPMGNEPNTNKTMMTAEVFTNENTHNFIRVFNFIKQVSIYLESIISDLTVYEIGVLTPELHKQVNYKLNIQTTLNLHLKRIIQISNMLQESKVLIEVNFTSEGPFKNFLRSIDEYSRKSIIKGWLILLGGINERIENIEYIKKYILFLLNHFTEGYTEDNSFEKNTDIEKSIKFSSNKAKEKGMDSVEYHPKTWITPYTSPFFQLSKARKRKL